MLKFVMVGSLIVFLSIAKNAVAHLIGQPPFFKINGVYSGYYNVPLGSSFFDIPQDIAPVNYLVGELVNLEIDKSVLPVPSEIVDKTNFIWSFGDGSTGSDLKNTHAYSKPGSYIQTIDAQYGGEGTTLLQSTMIHVIPSKDYQLPKAVIEVNGKQPKDPLTDFFNLKFGQELRFDASKSEGEIVEYIWDFGDSQTSKEAQATHAYRADLVQAQVFPILRVKDKNGFISDTFMQINNSDQQEASNSSASSGGLAKAMLALVIGIPILVVLILGAAIIFKKE